MLVAAAAIAFFIGIVHSILGERYILIRLFRRNNLPKLFGSDWFTKRTIRFAWHLTTIAWWGYGALLLSPMNRNAVLTIVAGVFLVHGILTFAGSHGRHLAWIAFFAIALLSWLAIA